MRTAAGHSRLQRLYRLSPPDVVVRQAEFDQARQVLQADQPAQRVAPQVQLLQAAQAGQAAGRAHAVVGEIEHAQPSQRVQPGQPADVVVVQVQNLQVHQLLQALDLAQSATNCSGSDRIRSAHERRSWAIDNQKPRI